MSRFVWRRGAFRGAFPATFMTLRATLWQVEYASMHSARMSIMAGTALALILTITTTAQTAPQASSGISPVTRDYSTPGSMPKPSTAIMPADDGMRFRDTLPSMGNTTPLAPAAPAPKAEPPAAPAAKVEPPAAPVAPAVAAK